MLPRLAPFFAALIISCQLLAVEPPAADASAEVLAKDSWLRDQAIENYKKCWDERMEGQFARNYSTGMLQLLLKYENLNLAYFEKIAREEDWEVYLVAYDELPEGLEIASPLEKKKGKAKFFLHIEGTGKETFLKRLKAIDQTPRLVGNRWELGREWSSIVETLPPISWS